MAGGAADGFHAAVQLALLDGQQTAEVVLEDGEIAGCLRVPGGLARGMQRGDCAQRFLCGGQVTTFDGGIAIRSEEHTSELQSLMRISYAVFCLKKKKNTIDTKDTI